MPAQTPWVQAYEDIKESLQPKTTRTYQSAPLLSYIKARDIDDYSKGEYSTTKYLEQNSNPDTVQFQKTLNHFGIKDNFGNAIKEDGLFGPKTMQAADNLKTLQKNFKGIGEKADNILSNETNDLNKTAELTVKPASSNQAFKMFADPKTLQQKITNINSTIEVIKSGGNKLISKVQEELNKSGYKDANGKDITTNGIWDSGTQIAAQKYLEDNADKKPIVNHTKKVYNTVNKNLEQQLTPPEKLVKKMSAFKGAYFSSGSSSDAVYWAQKALNNLGYSDASNIQLPLDGKLTENTQYAITQFQQKSGLNPTGALDAKTLSLLNKPFQLNGKNLLYGNFGEEIKQTEVVNVAENMLSTMKPNTMVEIPYKVVAAAADDTNGRSREWVKGKGINFYLMIKTGFYVNIQFLEDEKGNKGTLFSYGTIHGPGISAGISKTYTKTDATEMSQLGGDPSYVFGASGSKGLATLGYERILGENYQGNNLSIGVSIGSSFIPYAGNSKSYVITDEELFEKSPLLGIIKISLERSLGINDYFVIMNNKYINNRKSN